MSIFWMIMNSLRRLSYLVQNLSRLIRVTAKTLWSMILIGLVVAVVVMMFRM